MGDRKDEQNVTRGSDIRFTPSLSPERCLGTPTHGGGGEGDFEHHDLSHHIGH